jgi:hypothetical protein
MYSTSQNVFSEVYGDLNDEWLSMLRNLSIFIDWKVLKDLVKL